MIILKGHPTQMSEEIELPDMGELMMYPYFVDTDLDSAYKHATWFQRKLIDMVKIDDSKKRYSLRSHVQIMVPNYRACTGGGGAGSKENDEWHIDNEETENRPGSILHEDRDIVTLLTNKTSAMTIFNKNEIKINLEPHEVDLMSFIQANFRAGNPLGIEGWEMPANRLVTFTNHLHKPSIINKIEMRYMFRLVQTNRERPSGIYDPSRRDGVELFNNGIKIRHMDRYENQLNITYPKDYMNYFMNGHKE